MARAAGTAGADSERATTVLTAVRTHAEELPVATPVQRAHSLTFAAESARADGLVDGDAWDAAATAWRDLSQPYPEACALLPAAQAVANDGDRTVATERLRRAAEIADRLAARPLGGQIDDLARRARLLLWPRQARPSDDPVVQAQRRLGLTPRELDVLHMVADGRSNRDIADQLFISAKTASVHVSHILTKLGVSTRVEAAAAAHRLRLFDD